MRGGIILSNRLRAMQEAAENFGESVAGTREAQRQAKMEAEDRAAQAKSRAIQDRAATAQATAAELTLGDFQRRDAARQEAEGLAGQIQDFGTAVPDTAIETEGALPGFQREQSMRPVGDTTAQALQDRIRASWMNADARAKGETAAFTAADIQRQRAETAAKKQRETEDRALDIRSKTADATGKELGNKKTKLEIDKLEAQINAVGQGPSKAITEDNKGVWDKLFSGYRTDSQSTKDSLGQIRKLEALVNGVATGASDIATLYTFIRSFDSPNSAVREAEAQMGQEAAGALNKLLNLRAKYEKGRILPDSVRAEMLQAVQTIKADHEKFLGATNSRYARLAQAGGLDPSLVVDQEFMDVQSATGGRGAASAPAARPSPAPAAGVATISSKEEWAALPPGTSYIGPDGKRATKR